MAVSAAVALRCPRGTGWPTGGHAAGWNSTISFRFIKAEVPVGYLITGLFVPCAINTKPMATGIAVFPTNKQPEPGKLQLSLLSLKTDAEQKCISVFTMRVFFQYPIQSMGKCFAERQPDFGCTLEDFRNALCGRRLEGDREETGRKVGGGC